LVIRFTASYVLAAPATKDNTVPFAFCRRSSRYPGPIQSHDAINPSTESLVVFTRSMRANAF